MAKYETALKGDFDTLLRLIENGVLHGSASASREDGSDLRLGNVRCAVRVFERYSMMGGNRVSMNITLLGEGEGLYVSVITSGGSQAMFFKINTFGEESFLDTVTGIIEGYKRQGYR